MDLKKCVYIDVLSVFIRVQYFSAFSASYFDTMKPGIFEVIYGQKTPEEAILTIKGN